MTQTSGSQEPRTAAEQASHAHQSNPPSPLDQGRVIVGTTAGVVFVVALLFFAGFFLSRATNGPSAGHPPSGGGERSSCPMMGAGKGMEPGKESNEPRQTTVPTPPSVPHHP